MQDWFCNFVCRTRRLGESLFPIESGINKEVWVTPQWQATITITSYFQTFQTMRAHLHSQVHKVQLSKAVCFMWQWENPNRQFGVRRLRLGSLRDIFSWFQSVAIIWSVLVEKILRKPIISLNLRTPGWQYWSLQVIQPLTAARAAGSLLTDISLFSSWKVRNHFKIGIFVHYTLPQQTKHHDIPDWTEFWDGPDTVLMSERTWVRHWRRAGAGTGCYWSPPTRLEKLGEVSAAACLLP